jgi:hypothetical protein
VSEKELQSLMRVDAKGNVLGFAIFNFLKHDRKTVEVPLSEAKLAVGR